MRSMSKERLQYIQSLLNANPARIGCYNRLALKALYLAVLRFDVKAWQAECRRCQNRSRGKPES